MENKEKVRKIVKNQGKVMENDEKVRKIMKNQRKILENEEKVRKNEGKPMKNEGKVMENKENVRKPSPRPKKNKIPKQEKNKIKNPHPFSLLRGHGDICCFHQQKPSKSILIMADEEGIRGVTYDNMYFGHNWCCNMLEHSVRFKAFYGQTAIKMLGNDWVSICHFTRHWVSRWTVSFSENSIFWLKLDLLKVFFCW